MASHSSPDEAVEWIYANEDEVSEVIEMDSDAA